MGIMMEKSIPCRENSTCEGTEVYKTPVHLGRMSNSLCPKSSVCARVGRDEVGEANKGQIIKDLACHAKELVLYLEDGGKPLEKFKQGMLRLAI